MVIPFQVDASGISRMLRMGWILGIQRNQSARDLKDLPPSKASVGVLFWSITQDWFYIECKYLDWWEEKHITYYVLCSQLEATENDKRECFLLVTWLCHSTMGTCWNPPGNGQAAKLFVFLDGCTWGSVPLAAAPVLCGRDHHAFDGAWTYVAI